jgi:hypothetical protein
MALDVTEFERRQLSAVKKELDYEYEAQVDLNRKLSKAQPKLKYPAVLELDRSFRALT